jgi:hypothetical protein
MAYGGWFVGHCVGTGHKNVLPRTMQYQTSFDEKKCLRLARKLIFAKVYNCRSLGPNADTEVSWGVKIMGQLKKKYHALSSAGITVADYLNALITACAASIPVAKLASMAVRLRLSPAI